MRKIIFILPLKRLFLSSIALILLGLSGCAALSPGPKNIQVPQAVLQQLIISQFPHTSQMMDLVDVLASNPRMKLDAATNRIHTGLDLGLSTRGIAALLGSQKLQGVLDMSYGLRFEPSDNSVRMTDVRVSNLQIKGTPAQLQTAINQMGPILAERLLKDYSLYKIAEKDLSAAKGWGYKPGAINVGSDGLTITLNPIEK